MSDQQEDMLIPFLASQRRKQDVEIDVETWAKEQKILPELQLCPLHSKLLNPGRQHFKNNNNNH